MYSRTRSLYFCKKMFFKRYFVAIIVFVYCIENFVANEPYGFLSECPGMNKTTTLSPASIRSLYLFVQRSPSDSYPGKRCPLTSAACIGHYLDFNKTTQIVVAGYLDHIFKPIIRAEAQNHLNKGRNVINVDTTVLVRQYPIAARLTKPVGIILGILLADLTKYGLMEDKVEMVGASLGAHISAHAAMKFNEIVGKKIFRVTGLDPAGPCFRNLPESERFNSKIAKYVDAIHTNIDGFGLADPVGQVDFYVNGGEFQSTAFGDLLIPCLVMCSHTQAVVYWISALRNPKGFIGVRCNSLKEARQGYCYEVDTNILGPKTDFSKTGIYYLPTSDEYPYYLGKNGLTSKISYHFKSLLKVVPDDDIVV